MLRQFFFLPMLCNCDVHLTMAEAYQPRTFLPSTFFLSHFKLTFWPLINRAHTHIHTHRTHTHTQDYDSIFLTLDQVRLVGGWLASVIKTTLTDDVEFMKRSPHDDDVF